MIDEVGQFVARDVQKMLDLQGIVQAMGRVGRGKMWVVGHVPGTTQRHRRRHR